MPVEIRIRFGCALRRIREEQGINQEEAAERCGLHRTYYSGIERGVRNVSLVNIEKVAKGLKTTLTLCSVGFSPMPVCKPTALNAFSARYILRVGSSTISLFCKLR